MAANYRAAIVADAIQRTLPPYTLGDLSKETRIPETSLSRILDRIKSVSHAKLDVSYRAIGLNILVVHISEKGYRGVVNNAVLSHWLKSATKTLNMDYLLTFTFPADERKENERAIIESIKNIDDKAEILGIFDEKVYAKPSLAFYKSRSALSPMQALRIQGSHPITRIVSYEYNITRFSNIKDFYKRKRRETYLYTMALGERNALDLTSELSDYLEKKRGLSRGKKSKALKYIDNISWAIRGSKLALLREEAVSIAFLVKAPSDNCLKEIVTNAMTYLYTSSITINERERKMIAVVVLPSLDGMIIDGLEELFQAGCGTVEKTIVLRKNLMKLTLPVTNFNINRWLPILTSRDRLEEIIRRKIRKYNLGMLNNIGKKKDNDENKKINQEKVKNNQKQ